MKHILSLSYGKDSLACLGAMEKLGLPLDRIVHAEVWATDTIPADLPPMVEFKAKADEIIKKRWGIEVEHVCAKDMDGTKKTYDKIFYRVSAQSSKVGRNGEIYGFPCIKGAWCNSKLKMDALKAAQGSGDDVHYVGIAVDEPQRLARLDGVHAVSPLALAGWTEADARKWCEDNDLLSPIYTTATRGGCWFCHNQSVEQLRLLRKTYPDLWALLLKWDKDSPVSFKPNRRTVHDYDKRFALEEQGLVPTDRTFRWKMIGDNK